MLGIFIQLTSSLWFQLLSVFTITTLFYFAGTIWRWIDLKVGYILTGAHDLWFQRVVIAPVKIISKEYIYPDPEIPIDRKNIGTVTHLAPLEHWLTHYPIDYSFFYNYEVDPKHAKLALSRVLSRIPIIGGVFCKINETSIGIDHHNPKIQFTYGITDEIPSCEDKDHKKENYYMKYMNGAHHGFPYPKGHSVFKVTLIHFPNLDVPNIKGKLCYKTLFSIGCSHALTDGEGFFNLMRCWAAEINGEEWITPSFDRSLLLIDPKELRSFKPDATVLEKHFDYMTRPTPWSFQAIFPHRRWTVKTIKFTMQDINNLKIAAAKGKMGDQLKIISTNDVITALFWKIRATLNRDYSFQHPVLCSMVINTRKWIPEKFPKNGIPYLGNGLGFLLLHATRQELIESDFSQVVYKVREAVNKIKKEDFLNDLHFYQHLVNKGVELLHCYHSRWAVSGYGFNYGRYLMDRDMMVSNLEKLDTHNINFGKGNPSRVRFNFQEDASNLTYLFALDQQRKELEYYSAIPVADLEFYDNTNITDPNLDWNVINQKYARETKRYLRRYPQFRKPLVNFSALFSSRRDVKFWSI